MTFTVEKIEQARRHVEIVIRSSHLPGWKENREAWDLLNATFLDYAAMKRREAESVPVGYMHPKDVERFNELHKRKGWNRELGAAQITSHESGTYSVKCYTSPPSQPSTGVPEGLIAQIENWCTEIEEADAQDFIENGGEFCNILPAGNVARKLRRMLAAAPRSP